MRPIAAEWNGRSARKQERQKGARLTLLGFSSLHRWHRVSEVCQSHSVLCRYLSGKVVECLELVRKSKWTRNLEPIRGPLEDGRGSVRCTIILQVLHCLLE